VFGNASELSLIIIINMVMNVHLDEFNVQVNQGNGAIKCSKIFSKSVNTIIRMNQ
jgi:hypothetical protein